MNLYQISADAEWLRRLIADAADDPDAADYTAALADVAAALDDAATEVIKQLRNYRASAEALKAESDRLDHRRRQTERAAQRLKTLLLLAMQQARVNRAGHTPFEATRKTIGRPAVIVPDVDAVPDNFVTQRVTRTPDKRKIGAHLRALAEAGEPAPNWVSIGDNETLKLN